MADSSGKRRISKATIRFIHWHERLVTYFQRYLTDKQFVTISGVLVGLSCAFAGIVLKTMVFYIHKLLFTEGGLGKISPFIYSTIPLFGIAITSWIIYRYFNGNIGGGNAAIVYAIRKKKSRLPRKWMYSHILTSAITVGTGGSTGLETPIVTTGAAIGANYGRTYKVTTADRTVLLASGVAAGIAATFNAPIAGVLFAIEVLVNELTIVSFIPILISAASGAILARIILNGEILLQFSAMAPFNYHNVPFYIVLGLLAGLTSVYYIRVFAGIESIFKRVKSKFRFHKAIIGGLLLGILILVFPPLFGEGYESIKILASTNAESLTKGSIIFNQFNNQGIFLLIVTAILILKVIATAITLGGGGNGGNFAPSLFTGAYLGFVYASALNLTGWFNVPVANFTVVAMAGVLAGIFHAPLTAIFLIAEITGGYDLMIPLMIVSALSFGVSRYFNTYSLDGKKLQRMMESNISL